jgi:NitT/TauT family transport system ATP-binding protein
MYKINKEDFHYNGTDKIFKLQIDNFFIKKGEIVFLHGPSGCGKSTFLNILSGVINSSISASSRNYFKDIEYVMHQPLLLPWLNIDKNINVANILKNKTCDRIFFKELCEKFYLENNYLKLKPNELSLGMRQRIEIALALSFKPGLLLLDEALSGIDRKTKKIVIAQLIQIATVEQIAIIGTAHQLSDMLMLAQRVYLMDKGKLKGEIAISEPQFERIKMSIEEIYKLESSKILLSY